MAVSCGAFHHFDEREALLIFHVIESAFLF